MKFSPYTPEALDEMQQETVRLTDSCLYTIDSSTENGADAESEQQYLLAIAALEQAQCFFKLAALKQRRAVAEQSGVHR